ncbi:MAG: hypothetical protein H6581_10720 [Bacteroidia bacterium]|nr:hypothetical protein [Bacteroidia bacterium]
MENPEFNNLRSEIEHLLEWDRILFEKFPSWKDHGEEYDSSHLAASVVAAGFIGWGKELLQDGANEYYTFQLEFEIARQLIKRGDKEQSYLQLDKIAQGLQLKETELTGEDKSDFLFLVINWLNLARVWYMAGNEVKRNEAIENCIRLKIFQVPDYFFDVLDAMVEMDDLIMLRKMISLWAPISFGLSTSFSLKKRLPAFVKKGWHLEMWAVLGKTPGGEFGHRSNLATQLITALIELRDWPLIHLLIRVVEEDKKDMMEGIANEIFALHRPDDLAAFYDYYLREMDGWWHSAFGLHNLKYSAAVAQNEDRQQLLSLASRVLEEIPNEKDPAQKKKNIESLLEVFTWLNERTLLEQTLSQAEGNFKVSRFLLDGAIKNGFDELVEIFRGTSTNWINELTIASSERLYGKSDRVDAIFQSALDDFQKSPSNEVFSDLNYYIMRSLKSIPKLEQVLDLTEKNSHWYDYRIHVIEYYCEKRDFKKVVENLEKHTFRFWESFFMPRVIECWAAGGRN